MMKETFTVLTEEELTNLVRQSVREEIKVLVKELQIPPNKEPPKLIRIKEVAKLLNVCPATIHSYKRKKLIPFKKVGGSLYFDQEKVLQAMREFNQNKKNCI